MTVATRAPKPPAEQREGLTIERYGEVMAHRRHFQPSQRTEVLLRLGIPPRRWAAASKAWGVAMADALGRDEPDLVIRFTQALGATGRRLREFPPTLASLGEPIDPNAPEPVEVAASAAPSQVPSYLREDRAVTPASAAWPVPAVRVVEAPSAPPGTGATADISAFVPRAAVPFSPEATPTQAPAAQTLPQVARAPQPFTGTADISAVVPRPAVPFNADAAAPPASVRRPSAPPPPSPAPGMPQVVRAPEQFTTAADISEFVRQAGVRLPKTAEAAPASTPAPGKRLIRFDPQTGKPLDAPVWVDVPEEKKA